VTSKRQNEGIPLSELNLTSPGTAPLVTSKRQNEGIPLSEFNLTSPGTAPLVKSKRQNNGIPLSEFNLTSPGSVPLVIQITPRQPSTVDVFLRRNSLPTTTDYDWFLTSWDSGDNYTVHIEADLLKDTSQFFVGVRSRTGAHSLTSNRVVLR